MTSRPVTAGSLQETNGNAKLFFFFLSTQLQNIMTFLHSSPILTFFFGLYRLFTKGG